MSSAKGRFERPANSISRFHGPRSMKRSGLGTALVVATSMPGRWVSSAVPLSIVESFLVDLFSAGDCEGPGRDVLRDDRARGNPSIVANRDRSNEHIVAAGVDVAADCRPEFAGTELRSVVGR